MRDPMGWLLGRGLIQRPACPDLRCDDGVRLDTRGECASCASLLADRRAVRARVRSETVADLPGASAAELGAALEERLREHTAGEAERTRLRHARAVAEVAARRAAMARRRQREEEAEQARRSAPCATCGLPEAAGLCPPCSYARHTDAVVREAVDLAVVVRADLDDPEQVARLTARCEADTRALITQVCRRRGGDEVWAAYAAQEIAEQVRDERRAAALRRLTASEDAVAEADAAYDAALRQRPRALQAAEAAADDAGRRAAGYLLRSRLGQLPAIRARAGAGRAPAGTASGLPGCQLPPVVRELLMVICLVRPAWDKGWNVLEAERTCLFLPCTGRVTSWAGVRSSWALPGWQPASRLAGPARRPAGPRRLSQLPSPVPGRPAAAALQLRSGTGSTCRPPRQPPWRSQGSRRRSR